jgi:hypothetical protein
MMLGGGVIETRAAGETYRIESGAAVVCRMPRATLRFDPATWEVLKTATVPAAADGELMMSAVASALALAAGLGAAAAHLPVASPAGAGTFVEHPGYEE